MRIFSIILIFLLVAGCRSSHRLVASQCESHSSADSISRRTEITKQSVRPEFQLDRAAKCITIETIEFGDMDSLGRVPPLKMSRIRSERNTASFTASADSVKETVKNNCVLQHKSKAASTRKGREKETDTRPSFFWPLVLALSLLLFTWFIRNRLGK